MFRTAIYLLAATMFVAEFPAAAQEARGTLLGRVSDTSDAVVAGAQGYRDQPGDRSSLQFRKQPDRRLYVSPARSGVIYDHGRESRV